MTHLLLFFLVFGVFFGLSAYLKRINARPVWPLRHERGRFGQRNLAKLPEIDYFQIMETQQQKHGASVPADSLHDLEARSGPSPDDATTKTLAAQPTFARWFYVAGAASVSLVALLASIYTFAHMEFIAGILALAGAALFALNAYGGIYRPDLIAGPIKATVELPNESDIWWEGLIHGTGLYSDLHNRD